MQGYSHASKVRMALAEFNFLANYACNKTVALKLFVR